MTTKKTLLLLFIFVIITSGVMGIFREVFLKEYEELYHFWISVTMGAISGAAVIYFLLYLGRKK